MIKYLIIFLMAFSAAYSLTHEEELRLTELGKPLFGEKEEETLENKIKNCSFRVGIWARNSEYEYCKCLYEIENFKTCKEKFDADLKEERLNPEKCLEMAQTHHKYEYDFQKYCTCQSNYYVNSGYYGGGFFAPRNPEDIASECREGKIFYVD